MTTKTQLKEGYERHTYYVCRDCGARYSGASTYAKSQHTKFNNHSGFIAKHEFREKEPMKITYQPGHGPNG